MEGVFQMFFCPLLVENICYVAFPPPRRALTPAVVTNTNYTVDHSTGEHGTLGLSDSVVVDSVLRCLPAYSELSG